MVCTCEKGSSRVGQNPLLFIVCQRMSTKKDSLSVCLGLSFGCFGSLTATLAVSRSQNSVRC